MTDVDPSRFAVVGRGFRADPYAIDGNSLRWAFDPRLGFPRHAFCVDVRQSVLGKHPPRTLIHDADLRLPAGTPPQTPVDLVLPEVEVVRPGGTLLRTTVGLALSGEPMVLRFRGASAHACWVRLRLVLRPPGGSVSVEARYLDRGEPVVVDTAAGLAGPVTVDLVLAAARIDDVVVTGALGDLERLSWIRGEDYLDLGDWKPIGCFPAATDEPEYVALNADLFDGADAAQLAKSRVLGHGPVGVEPLDEPVVPPPRPATDEQKARRYLEPWLERLNPWLELVLARSRDEGIHQSEVEITGLLDDAGQRRGAGIAPRLRAAPPSVTFAPYDALYAAGLVGFPTALLLGLACVHRDAPDELLDYRVRGRWQVKDVQTWVGALDRRLRDLLDRLAAASAAELPELQAEIVTVSEEVMEAAAAVQALVASAVDGEVHLRSLALGLQPATQPLFAGPATVTVEADGLGIPPDHAGEGTVAVSWDLRARARVVDDTLVPTAACIARTTGAGDLDDVRNPNDPADDTSPPVAVIPAGPPGAPGTAGVAVFADRYVADGVDYTYGVSECDPFGRWSPFTRTAFRWDDLTPPMTPAQVTAELDEVGAPLEQVLTVRFSWPVDLVDPDALAFEVYVRRAAPDAPAPMDPAGWPGFERAAGTTAGPFTFAGSFTGATTHDGMAMSVTTTDETRDTPHGPQQYRTFAVRAEAIVVPYDLGDRAQAWVAVGSRNARGTASDLGGPAKAEHIRVVPPPPPVFPPEPLLATFPDADARSTFTLTWAAPAGRRSVVYRAGEHDLVAMAAQRGLTTTWRADDEPALRSAAVRAVAPALRDAFAPVSALLPAGTSAYTDGLGGGLRTLSLYTVVGSSPALVPGPWPSSADGFLAVAVPQVPQPAVPVVVRAEHTDAGVVLQVAEPPAAAAPVGAYEVYRALETVAERAQDWRRMRPAGRFVVGPDSYAERPAGPPRVMTLRDDDAVLAWVGYLYRVVARGVPGGLATRSLPSAVARVVTRDPDPPAPPEVVEATGTATGTDLTVTWTARAPDGPAGRFRFEVLDPAGPYTLARVEAGAARDPTDPTRYSVAVADRGTAEQVLVVVTDPLARRTSGPPAPIVLA